MTRIRCTSTFPFTFHPPLPPPTPFTSPPLYIPPPYPPPQKTHSNDGFDATTGVDGQHKPESLVNLTGDRRAVLWIAHVLLALGVGLLATILVPMVRVVLDMMCDGDVVCDDGYVTESRHAVGRLWVDS